jgi:hypothetical protein
LLGLTLWGLSALLAWFQQAPEDVERELEALRLGILIQKHLVKGFSFGMLRK